MEIFTAALRLSPGERAAYLTDACGGDEQLRFLVEELLKTEARLGGFMAQGADAALQGLPREDAGDKSGSRIGRYRLIEKIGEGGCGVIYLAEQEEPVRRQVALKIIKPGMDTKDVIARFEAERQVLALMDHPGIAKVFDAGETEAGRPYFVMELIRGIKITDYCDQHALTTEERLRLFVLVCQAVQHAHQKGIIHRDLKPSNILVTATPEGGPNPVVIDFGIAKATTNLRLSDKTIFTAFAMLVGTPAYMSPEQMDLNSADVDTRSDIYSLGVLLYEMLTGSTPFEAGELLKLGLDEVRRVLREEEPVRPSTRLSKMTGSDITLVAKRRRAEAPALIRTVRGDLDWIAMRALEKDRTRRYDTASGLALDIDRFLSDEAVSARPASRWYRFQKAYARNRLLFSGLALIAVVLVGSLLAVSTSLVRERRARDQAEQARKEAEADRAAAQAAAVQSEQVSKFIKGMLGSYSRADGQKNDTTILKEILDNSAARAESQLPDAPAARAELQKSIADAYSGLDLFDKAIVLYRASLASTRESYGNRTKQTAAALEALAERLLYQDKYAEAEALFQEALSIQRGLHGADPNPDVAKALRSLATVLWETDRKDEAEALVREAWGILKIRLGENHPDTTVALYGLAIISQRRMNLAESEAMAQQVFEAWSKPQRVNPAAANALWIIGDTQSRAGKQAQSESSIRQAIAMQGELYSEPPTGTAHALGLLSRTLVRQGRLSEAENAARQSLAILEKAGRGESPTATDVLEHLANALECQGRLTETEAIMRDIHRIGLKLSPGFSARTAEGIALVARSLVSQQRIAEADTLLAQQLLPDAMPAAEKARCLFFRAHYRARLGRWMDAMTDAKAVLEYDPTLLEYYHVLAPLLLANGKLDERAVLVRAAFDRFGATKTPLVAAWLTMDCMILPGATMDSARCSQLADIAVGGGVDGNWAAYAQLARALVDFRQGNYSKAIVWSEKSTHSFRSDIRIMSHAVQAMSQQKLNRPTEARAALKKARELATTALPAESSGDFGADWVEWIAGDRGTEWKGWLYSRALLSEANSLVQPNPE
jgi:serine/threonine protein kinase/tetratricopeptide (TPR) repeat protein